MQVTVPNAQAQHKVMVNWTWEDVGGGGGGAAKRQPDAELLERLADRSLTPADRLMMLRAAAGVLTAAEMSRRLGVPEATYQHHENGNRTVGRRTALTYAAYFGITPELLLHGAPSPSSYISRQARVVGAVVAGGRIIDRMSLTSPGLPAALPIPVHSDTDLDCLVVTEDLYPAHLPGDVVFFDSSQPVTPREADRRKCIVQLAGGERLMRVVRRRPDSDTVTLLGLAADQPKRVVRPEAIWLVLLIQPNGLDIQTS